MNADVHTLAGAYALDAVDDIERAAFARHMAECPACAVEVAELQATSARLAEMVAEPPPPGLRAAVLTQIRQTRQVGPRRRGTAGSGRRAGPRRVALAAAVAAVVAVGVGAGTYTIQERRVRHAQEISAVLGAPDARTHSEPASGGGQVRVVVSPSKREVVAYLSDLPAPGAGHSYQLWLIQGSAGPKNMGIVMSGNAMELIPNLNGADTFAVSREVGTAQVSSPSQDRTAVPLS
jgi:anti-sigma-K factor RskA